MDIRKVKKLIELLEESGIAEIEIKEGEESVRISRHRGRRPCRHLRPMHARRRPRWCRRGGAAPRRPPSPRRRLRMRRTRW